MYSTPVNFVMLQATSGDIPLIVRSCVVSIEENGIKMEGIFRVPGPSQTVDDLRRAFEDGKFSYFCIVTKQLFTCMQMATSTTTHRS